MSFKSYKPFRKRNQLSKYLIVFLLGTSFSLFFSSALNIVTGIENATQYIKQIILTSNGAASWTTGIILDWLNWRVWTTSICDSTLNNCKLISNLATLWQFIFQSNWANIYYTWWNVGIWTNNPSQKLQVVWNILASWTWTFSWNVLIVWNTSTYKIWSNQTCSQGMINCNPTNVSIQSNNSISIITWTTNNFINWIYSTIWWWIWNKIYVAYWFIWWWQSNELKNGSDRSTVWWWSSNIIDWWSYSTIWWWTANQVKANEWTIWWWYSNKINAWEKSTIWWWQLNEINWEKSTIWWWYSNKIEWNLSTIPWWHSNEIYYADYSFAVWRNAYISHNNTFMRNWSSSTFASSKTWTFLINSPNWVWINTNNPEAALDVNWDLNISWTWTMSRVIALANLKVPWLSSAPWSSNDCSSAWAWSIKYEWWIMELCVCDWTNRKKVYSWSLLCIPWVWWDPID